MKKQADEVFDFQKQRDFGELMSSPFNFLKQEFRLYTTVILRYVAPFLGIGLAAMAVFANDLYLASGSSGGMMSSTMITAMVFFVFFMLSFFMAFLISHSYATLYVKRGKDNFTKEDVWALAKKNILKYIGATILTILMVLPAMLFFYIPGIYLAISLTFVFFIITYEELPVGAAISRSFKVIKGHWWMTFGVIMVFGMLIGFASYIFMIPAYFVGIIAATSGTGFEYVDFIIIVILMFGYFATYLIMSALQQILVVSIYFSYTSKSEGINLDAKIDAIYKSENTSEQKSKIEDYYPELGNNPSWTEAPKEKPKNESNKTEINDNKKENDDYNRYRKKDDRSNRFLNNEDDNDRFKPKY